MKSVVVIIINIYCPLLQYANSQYIPEVYSGIHQGYQYPYQNIAYSRYSNQRTFDYDNNKWSQGNYEDYNDYVEEHCACDKCDETITKPACRNVCPNCFITPPPVIAPNYVFLPFPYPYPITPNTTVAPVPQTVDTTTASTTESTTTTTEASTTEMNTKEIKTETIKTLTSETVTLSNALPEENNDVFRDISPFNIKEKGQYTLTALRQLRQPIKTNMV
nr:uncharacterized protein LOC117988806 [Maniola hyperantus]